MSCSLLYLPVDIASDRCYKYLLSGKKRKRKERRERAWMGGRKGERARGCEGGKERENKEQS